jgi:flavin reductase (DIM6/NTAB) family NADH-FMN oxidoreductase RutF
MDLPERGIEDFLEKLDVPMYVVTVAAAGERSGCLVGFVTQCSIVPPRLLVCISEKNYTHRVAAEAGVMALHLVPSGASDIVRLFGSETGDDIDKFSRCEWFPGPSQVPLLAECPSRMVCRVLDRFAVGDHTAHVVEPLEVSVGPEPVVTLAEVRKAGVKPGHAP